MSLLGILVPEWRREEAATVALAYLLDPNHSPGMVRAFADLLCRSGVPAFEFGSIEKDSSQKHDSRPDLTIGDTDGTHRVSVETTFWNDLDEAQPDAYLKDIPADTPGALVFITPQDRTRSLWRELKGRCENSRELDFECESRADDATWARLGTRVLVVTSWTSVLDTLQRAASEVALAQDVLQLRGLTDRIDKEAFPPLTEYEVGNTNLAHRIKGYQRLVDKITDRLVDGNLARIGNRSYRAGAYRTGRGTGRFMRLHEKFDLRFGIELTAWRDSGITPLWWVLKSSDTFTIERYWLEIMRRLENVRSYGDSLYIPIRLKTGVQEADVIASAVEQMRRIAATLRDTCVPEQG